MLVKTMGSEFYAFDAETLAVIAVKVDTDSYLHERNLRVLTTVVCCKLLASAKHLSFVSLGEMLFNCTCAELMLTVESLE